ncbi:FGGY-family carbohydrate kinase [Photobacterium nomapromontoriensis]|uniref:FGGY-family carbohydrate kinase n=1 Tax=Photobacterium nomapromontoriensis TaxID=2910237 RepID=UPI003D0E6545
MAYFLGIDFGGTVTKAGLYNTDGHELAVEEYATELLSDHAGFAERDMEQLWQAVCHVTQSVIAKACVASNEIAGIGFSSHGKGLYAIDKHGNPVRNGIVSSDTRALNQVLSWKEAGIDEKAYRKGRQQLWTGHPVSLLAWLKQNEPGNYDKIDTILMVHDYIRFRMTGERSAEITNISGSNIYNLEFGNYDTSLLADFGIEECQNKLAPIIQSAQVGGFVTAQAASQLGVAMDTPVVGGMFDVVATAVSSGLHDATVISAAAGTWSIATALSTQIAENEHPYIWGNYCIPGQYFVHEGSPTSASNLAWWHSHLIRHLSLEQCNAFVENTQKTLQTGTPSSLFYLPYLYGSNYQLGMPAGLLGLEGHHTDSDVVNAIYEGIVFSHLINQDKVLAVTPNAQVIRMNGGPTQSKPWMTMFASASGLPIEISQDKQTGCKAAAICAAVGTGYFADFNEAMQHTYQAGTCIDPVSSQHEYLREKYQRYLALNDMLSVKISGFC